MRGLIRARLVKASDAVVGKQIASTAIDNTAKNAPGYQPLSNSVTHILTHKQTGAIMWIYKHM